jgi:hypothetical protein
MQLGVRWLATLYPLERRLNEKIWYVREFEREENIPMMPQKEVNEAMHQQAEPDYGRYEGNQTSYEPNLREGSSSKVYPFPRDNTNLLRFALVVISLVLLLLFGYLFVVVVGGMPGAISFAAACFVICCVLAYSWMMRPSKD